MRVPLLGELERGPLGVREHRRFVPGGDQVEADRGLAGVGGVLGVHVLRRRPGGRPGSPGRGLGP